MPWESREGRHECGLERLQKMSGVRKLGKGGRRRKREEPPRGGRSVFSPFLLRCWITLDGQKGDSLFSLCEKPALDRGDPRRWLWTACWNADHPRRVWYLFCLFPSFSHNQLSHITSLTSAGNTGKTGHANLLAPSQGGSCKKC